MTFDRPELLALAPLLALLFALALGSHWRRLQGLERSYDRAAVPRLLPVSIARFPTGRLLSLIGAGVAIGLAAAGPGWLAPEPPEPTPPLDVAIAVDLSLSMSATDAAPSRIVRARQVISQLTEELPSVRFSLVVFAAWPYTLLPPTDDPAVVRYFADSLRVDLVAERDRGSSLSGMLALARSTLEARPTPGARRAVLMLSDGELYEDEGVVANAASDAAAEGLQIWVGGLGREAGAALSVEGEAILDEAGDTVVSTLHADLLRTIADAGQGGYEDVTDEPGLRSLIEDLRELSGDAEEGAGAPVDATFLLTLLAIPLLLWDGAADAGRGSTQIRPPRAAP